MEGENSAFLAFTGSPRKKGNTETLLDSVANGIEQAGGSMEIIRICDQDIGPCIGCGGCEKTGRCVIDDDMQPIYDKVLATKKVIIASPIYFYALSGQVKVFVDRMQALWSRKQLLRAENKWHIPPEKKGYFLSVAATKGAKIFDGSKMCIKYVYDAMGFNYSGEFYVRGVEKRKDLLNLPEKIQEAEEFGRSIAGA